MINNLEQAARQALNALVWHYQQQHAVADSRTVIDREAIADLVAALARQQADRDRAAEAGRAGGRAEPVVEAHRALVVEALPTALVEANYLEAETVGLEDIAAKLRRLHRLEKVVKAVEDGESFEVLEKLAADFRKGLK